MTIREIFEGAVRECPDAVFQRFHDGSGWRNRTYREAYERMLKAGNEKQVGFADLRPDDCSARADDRERGRDVVYAGHDDFIAWLEMQIAHDKVKAWTATVYGSGVFGADILCELGLEVFDWLRGETESIGYVH